MQNEQIFVGIRRQDERWDVRPIETIVERDLVGIDVHTDLRAVMMLEPDLDAARGQLVIEAGRGSNPFAALEVRTQECCGLELVRWTVWKRIIERARHDAAHLPTRRAPRSQSASRVMRHDRDRLLMRVESQLRAHDARSMRTRDALLLQGLSLVLDGLLQHLDLHIGDSGHLRELARSHVCQRRSLGFAGVDVVREYNVLFECIVDLAKEGGSGPSTDEMVELQRLFSRLCLHSLDAHAEIELRHRPANRTSALQRLVEKVLRPALLRAGRPLRDQYVLLDSELLALTWHAPWCGVCPRPLDGWRFEVGRGCLAGLGFEISWVTSGGADP
jgi:hypothetical protein